MAVKFLIALGTALGSATFMLLVLRVALKVFRPKVFDEAIRPKQKLAVLEAVEPCLPTQPMPRHLQVGLLIPYDIRPRAVRPVQSRAPSLGSAEPPMEIGQQESPQLEKLRNHPQATVA
jgi:hypothetical protein